MLWRSRPCFIRRRRGEHSIKGRSLPGENISVCRIAPATKRSGFALPGVLFLSLVISAMIPVMISLSRESATAARADQIRTVAAGGARHMFLVAHAYMLMHNGLPSGWQKGNSPDASDTGEDLAYCSGYAGYDDDSWRQGSARVFRLIMDEDSRHFPGSRMLAGIYQQDQGGLAFDTYIVIGCLINDGAYAQGASFRGEFARASDQLILLSLAGGTT